MKLPKLLQLALDNAAHPKRLTVEDKGGAEATLYMYDVIDNDYGVSDTAFADALNSITAPKIHLRINSPGGDVFAARAMVTAIAAHKSTIVAHIDGLAASAASYVAMAADEVEISDGGFLMIHKAWTGMFGNADDFTATAALLSKIDASIVSDYARRTGKDEAQITDWMSAETWFSAQEALDQGFVNSIATNEKGAKTQDAWNLSAYANAPAPADAPEPDPQLAEQVAAQLAHNRNRMRLLAQSQI
jgi:ATP-dependent Clp protease protease subunit